MNIRYNHALTISILLVLIISSFTVLYFADPPIVSNIEVCEGESTVIIPEAPDMEEEGGGEDGFVPIVIAFEDFDGGGVGYTASSIFNDSNNDHFSFTDGSNISNVSGPYSFQDGTNIFWAAEDTDDNGGNGDDEQTLSLNTIDISGYTDIQVCFDLAAGSELPAGGGDYDDNDHVWVDYTLNGITSRALCFESALDGDAFNSTLNYDIECDGDGVMGQQILNQAMTFCYSIPNSETAGFADLDVDIKVFMDSADEEIAFDNIEIIGEIAGGGPIAFNFYDEFPTIGVTIPVAENQLSYDPMTTAATSPDTIWVTTVDGQMESLPSQVIVIVNPLPEASLVTSSAFACGVMPIEIEATPIQDGLVGSWSGGAGSFGDEEAPSTSYIPTASELDEITFLTWEVDGGECGVASVDLPVYLVQTGDPAFSYLVDTLCPGDGSLFPFYTNGEPGTFSVVDGDPEGIDLDPATGEVTLSQTEMGSYTIRNTLTACGNMMISGVLDGPIPGGLPKVIELYAVQDIANLSDYGVGSANNGGGSDGEEFEFDHMQVSAGTYIYIATDSTAFEAFFGFKPDFVSNAALINGDDAIELFCNGLVIDVFGEQDVDGTGQSWNYLDGWAYRKSDDEINLGVFIDTSWNYSGANALDGETDNGTAAIPFPIGTFTTNFEGICPPVFHDEVLTIGDFEPPMIVCPSDMTISLSPGDCGEFVYLMDPSAMDNCSDTIIFVQLSGPESGDFLDKENSPYTVVYEGTEMDGNIINCTYTITVQEYEPTNNTMACNGYINVSLDNSCEAIIAADMLLEGNNYGCYEDYLLSATLNGSSVGVLVSNDFGSGQSLILDGSVLNQLVDVSVTDPETGNTCWGTVVVEDKIDPIFVNCRDTTVVCGANTDLVVPDISENCSISEIIVDENEILGTCQDEFYMQIVRTLIAVDINGNASESCTQVTTILRDAFEDLVFPPNYDGLPGNEEALSCDEAGVEYAVDSDGIPSPTQVGFVPGTGVPILGSGCAELIIYKSDDIIETCGTTYKVLRNWTVVDWCSGMTAEHTQIIKVMDGEGPVFNLPANVTVDVNTNCEGEYALPLIAAQDNCNETTVAFSSSQGTIEDGIFFVEQPILGAPYTIEVSVTDECGNATTLAYSVFFEDLTAPVIVAETSLTVSLTPDGTATLFAESFDDGSFDACTDVGFDIIRMVNFCPSIDFLPPTGNDNFQFNGVVHFCCSDVGAPQMVQLRVCDDADQDDTFGSIDDNCNFVMVEVIVQDKLAPSLSIPANTTVSCIDIAGIDLTDTDLLDELFGSASGAGSCDVLITQSAVGGSSCLAGAVGGKIFRTFTATNTAGNTMQTQEIDITVDSENVLTCNRIGLDTENSVFSSLSSCAKDRFQNGPTQFACNPSRLRWWCAVNDNQNNNTDDIPALAIDCTDGFVVPQVVIDIDGLCTEAGVNIGVDTFLFAGGACKKYLVHYEVIDQCIFDDNYVDPVTGEVDPFNSGNGYFELYLEIDAFDNDGPELDCQDVSVAATSCTGIDAEITISATDVCTTDPAFFGYQWRLDVGNDNTIDFPASGWYSSSAATAAQVGLSEFPVGTHKFFWIVADGCGNSSTCSQIVTITDNEKQPTPYCKTGFVTSISAMGMVTIKAEDFDAGSFDNCDSQEDLRFSFSSDVNDTERNYTCEDLGFQFLQVYVTDLDGNQDFCGATFLVQDNGNFCTNTLQTGTVVSTEGYINKSANVVIEDIEQGVVNMSTDENGEYLINPDIYSQVASMYIEDNQDILMGVTTFDIITIQKHILGIAQLESNKAIIAADVDNNGVVSGSDIIQIRKVILGHKDYFKNNTSWVAYPSTVDLEELIDPFSYPKSVLVGDMVNFDWTTIKVGDVNTSHQFTTVEIDTRTSYNLEYDEREESGAFVYDFYGDLDELVGLDLRFENINSENFLSIESELIDISSDNVKIEKELRVLWSQIAELSTDGSLFSLTLSKPLHELEAPIANQRAYFGTKTLTDTYSVHISKRTKVDQELLSLVRVYPNPFSASVSLDLSDIARENVDIVISDVTGKIVLNNSFEGGSIIVFEADEFTLPGLYTIQIKTQDQVFIKKLIKLAN